MPEILPRSLNCVGLQFRAWGPRQEVTSILREVTAGLLPGFTVLMNQPSLFVTNSDSEFWAGHRGWSADSTLAAYPVCMTMSFLTLLLTGRPWLGGDFGWARAFCCCHMHLHYLPPFCWLIVWSCTSANRKVCFVHSSSWPDTPWQSMIGLAQSKEAMRLPNS